MSDIPVKSDIFSWFIGNPVAANLLMVSLILGGIFIARDTPIETFPVIDPHMITVSVSYPGAAPGEIELSINQRLEEAISGIKGIHRISSIALEGIGTVKAELEDRVDKYEVLDNIQTAVDRLANFPPEDADETNITIAAAPQIVIAVAVFGDVSEINLREFAYNVRDELTSLEGISIANVLGVRDYEIAIEVNESSLRKFGLSFSEIADAVRKSSINLPGGKIQTSSGEILLRTDKQATSRIDFERIVLRTQSNGSQITLADVAEVNDGFQAIDAHSKFNGKPAAYISVERTGDQQMLEIEQSVRDHIAQLALPAGIETAVWFNEAENLRSSVDLLADNALLGLILVFATLVLFLNLKLAFWTTVGIPVAFLGGFMVIHFGGGTINMISLFAFIVVLGLVVDDAIIIGESIFARREQGHGPVEAAVAGLMDVISPVTIGVLTTIMASLPLIFTTGFLGQLLSVAPLVVIGVLLVSLVEAFLILPSHLSNIHVTSTHAGFEAIQSKLRTGLQNIIEKVYAPTLKQALKIPYVIVAIAIASLLLVIGAINGGLIKTVMFPTISGNVISASIHLPNGSPAAETQAVVHKLIDAAEQTRSEYDMLSNDGDSSVIRNISASVGITPWQLMSSGSATTNFTGRSHRGEVVIQLQPNENRDFTAAEIESRWRELAIIPAGVDVYFSNRQIGNGSDISVALSHKNHESLLLAVEKLKSLLAEIEGVIDLQDSFQAGKTELQLSLTDAGLAAGLNVTELARQVRQAYQGEEVQRLQRGRDDIRVLVRYTDKERRDLDSIYKMRVRLDNGEELPFLTVAEVTETRASFSIHRLDRKRMVEIDAEVIEDVANADEINAHLVDNVLPMLARQIPGLEFSFEGDQRELARSLTSLMQAMVIAIVSIYGLLAVQLRSYTQPLIIMSVIPVGIVGAIFGHILLGFPVSFLSFFGIVALSGVVVNDSLILMDLINRLRDQGMSLSDAVIESSKRRFRPIIFTSLTTCVGLAPIIAERSTQAQLLIPMALSLASGILFATFITLFLVPALYMIRSSLPRFTSGN